MSLDAGARASSPVSGRPGVVAVARAAGVSASTVSNVYNRPHVVSAELRERVLRAASELGYGGPHPAARSLRSGRTSAIGVVIRERLAHAFEDTATVRVLQGVSDAADPHQLGLVIVPAYPEQGTTDGPAVRHAAVDGLILYSLAGDDPLIEAARRRRLPIVVVDSPTGSDCPAVTALPFVGIDEQAAAGTAVRHLLDLGHRRLGVLSLRLSARDRPGPAGLERQAHATASVPKGRLAGAARAVAAGGLAWADVPVVQCRISSVEDGRAAVHALLDADPSITALFALSDALALGARVAAQDRGLSVPGDLSIVGFDDSASAAEGLTTVHQPLREKGCIATELLLRTLAGDPDAARRPALLPTRLVVRGSTAAVAAGRGD
jgi:DNA-binding LacI/PurR family transcriptional regulator